MSRNLHQGMKRRIYSPELSVAWANTLAIRCDGIAQYAWVANPSYQTDTAGALSLWVRFPALLTVAGVIPIVSFNDSGAGNDATLNILLRKNAGYADGQQHIEVIYRATNGATPSSSSHPTAIAANTWYHIAIGSAGNVIVNGNISAPIKWFTGYAFWTGQWYGTVSGTNHDMAFAALRRAGSVLNYGQCDIDEILYIDRPLTAPEWAAVYNGGTPGDPTLIGLGSALRGHWRCGESPDTYGAVYDRVGTNHLTNVGYGVGNPYVAS